MTFTTTLLIACGGTKDDPGDSQDSGTESPIDLDHDGVTAAVDCDDENASVYPGAEEVCDGVDNDCNGFVDDAPGDLFYDRDLDGYGDPAAPVPTCQDYAPDQVSNQADCDDDDPEISPSSVDLCDSPNVDRNCDGKFMEANCAEALISGEPWMRLGGAGLPNAIDLDLDGTDDVIARLQSNNTAADGCVAVFPGPTSSGSAGTEGWRMSCEAGRATLMEVHDFVPIEVGKKKTEYVATSLPDFLPGQTGGPVSLFSLPLVEGSLMDGDYSWTSVEEASAFGTSLAVGDLNNDGHDDVIVGAPGWDSTKGVNDDAGAVFLLSWPFVDGDPEVVSEWSVVGQNAGDNLGASVGCADVDGDGVDDLLMSAPQRDLLEFHGYKKKESGSAGYVLLGPVSGKALTDADIVVNAAGMRLSATDLTGDGVADLVAHGWSKKRCNIYSGKQGGELSGADALVQITSEYTFISCFGTDLNGDGNGDVAATGGLWDHHAAVLLGPVDAGVLTLESDADWRHVQADAPYALASGGDACGGEHCLTLASRFDAPWEKTEQAGKIVLYSPWD